MQTFLPSTSFHQSAKWLDNARLGKQRVECYQILKALTDPSYGWQNHPAVKMWRGHEMLLTVYAIDICNEWTSRGYKDICKDKIMNVSYEQGQFYCNFPYDIPAWLTEEFASNHRSILLGKVLEKRDNCDLELAKCLDIREDLTIGSIEEVTMTKQARKIYRQIQKAELVVKWYQSHNWTEQPATRNDKGKWPYQWPTPPP